MKLKSVIKIKSAEDFDKWFLNNGGDIQQLHVIDGYRDQGVGQYIPDSQGRLVFEIKENYYLWMYETGTVYRIIDIEDVLFYKDVKFSARYDKKGL